MRSQLALHFPSGDGPWALVNRVDSIAAELADGHYSRQTPGDDQYMRPGQSVALVHRGPRGHALWAVVHNVFLGTWRWVNTHFANRSGTLSSFLVETATRRTYAEWVAKYGALPELPLTTEVDIEATRRRRSKRHEPGHCYRVAGWREIRVTPPPYTVGRRRSSSRRRVIDVSLSGHYIGDCRELLKQLPDACVQTLITSPPFYGLRDYGHEGQIGLEETPELFVAELVGVFGEVHRVLRDDGTLWVNLGDSYAGGGRGGYVGNKSTLEGSVESQHESARARRGGPNARGARAASGSQKPAGMHENVRAAGGTSRAWTKAPPGYKDKDLLGVPWMFAFAMRAAGWYLRSDIIWHKPNPLPEPVSDRPTKSHEHIFLFSKRPSYFYNADAVREPLRPKTLTTYNTERRPRADEGENVRSHNWARDVRKRRAKTGPDGKPMGANKRDVWTVGTQPYDGAHFATFPPKLIEPCVLAGSRPGDLVLDIFFGSGTTGAVAEKYGRRWIGFDLGYEELAKERTAQRSLPMGATEP